MKRMIAFTLIALLLLTTACQPTPESPIVIGKDQGIMLEQAQQMPQPGISLQERLACPERYVDELELSNEIVTVHIDAKVSVPNVDKISVMRIHATDFSQEITSLMFDRLCDGLNMLEVQQTLTKGQIEETILDLKHSIEDPEYADSEFLLDWYAQEITRLEKLYPSAPETLTPIPCDGTLSNIYVMNPVLQITYQYTGIDAYDEQTQAKFYIRNNTDLQQGVHIERKDKDGKVIGGGGMAVKRDAYMHYSTQEGFKNFAQHPMLRIVNEEAIPAEAEGKLSMTPAQARRTVEAILEGTDMAIQAIYLTDDENMGNFDGKVSAAETYVYRVYCVRQTKGVMQSFIRDMAMPADDGTIAMAPSWEYERMEMFIGNDGVISLSWTSPHTMGDIVVGDAHLLSFEEIMNIFNKMLPLTLETAPSIQFYKGVEIEIDHIVLEQQRIIEQNSIENGLLVPVWNFYGTRKNIDESGETNLDHNGVFDPCCLLTINAIDGSIIDIGRGY